MVPAPLISPESFWLHTRTCVYMCVWYNEYLNICCQPHTACIILFHLSWHSTRCYSHTVWPVLFNQAVKNTLVCHVVPSPTCSPSSVCVRHVERMHPRYWGTRWCDWLICLVACSSFPLDSLHAPIRWLYLHRQTVFDITLLILVKNNNKTDYNPETK